MGLGCFLCKDRLLTEKCLSIFRNNIHNLNDSYEPIIRRSEMSTSTGGVDDQDNQMLHFVLTSFINLFISLCHFML